LVNFKILCNSRLKSQITNITKEYFHFLLIC
jgi:hypothetical protein